MKDTILIDLGDTLVKNKEISIKNGLVAIYNYLNIKQKEFVDYGINLFNIMDNSRQKTSIEISLNDYLTKLFEKLGIDKDLINEKLEEIFYENCEKNEEIKDAQLFLKYLKQKKYLIIIVSNSIFSSKLLKITLEEFKLLAYIDEVYSSSDLGFRKPSREISEKVSKELQLVKEKCLMIGNDIRIDGGFATNSDIDFIWFNSKNEQGNCPKMIANINVYTELIEKWGEIID